MRYLGTIPFGDYTPDYPDLSNPGSDLIKNVVPHSAGYFPFRDIEALTDAMNSQCLGAFAVKANNGTIYNYAGTATKLYTSGALTHTDVTRLSGAYTTSGNYWDFTKWGNKVIATNLDDEVQIITNGDANFANLGGSPPQAKFVTSVRDFVVLAHIASNPSRVQWSGINDETAWTSSNVTQSDFQDLQSSADNGGGDITGIVGGERGVIFQEKSIWTMDYVGSPVIFSFNEKFPGLGCTARNSIVRYGDMIWFLGPDGFYQLFNGEFTPESPIGHNKVDRTFFNDIDTSNLDNVIGAYDSVNKLVAWIYPSVSSGTNIPDKMLIYSWMDRRWATADVNATWLYSSISASYTLENLATVSSSIDALGTSLDSKTWQGGTIQLGGYTTDHKRAAYTGSIKAATLETAEKQISTLSEPPQNKLTHIQGIRPLVDGTTTVKLRTRNHQTGLLTESSASSVNSHSGIAPFRNTSRYHRIQVTTSGDWSYATGIDVYGKMEGER